ncbi:MAG: hypothetical protein Ta2B_27350 [Termitinemataceae bacterium]|nr:MAG: hypothetical protein Ta2B_27350 [Termitinemataceae bacterium]
MDVLGWIAVTSFVFALIYFIFFIWHGRNKSDPFKIVEKKDIPDGQRGQGRLCPICAALFLNGETVLSKRFPSTGRFDRLLHIQGCKFCLTGQRTRLCPVCGNKLRVEDYLVARITERPGKSHVHVQGCNNCCIKR